MKRGFKTKAEEQALSIRGSLHVDYTNPLLAANLAAHFRIPILSPHDIPGIEEQQVRQLLDVDPSSWSAVCIPVYDWHIIIFNSSHSQARCESDLTHELAHVVCGHKPSEYVALDGTSLLMRASYDISQEEEADWLCGCLKLPRNALLWAVRRGMSNQDIASHFIASESLVAYRRNITGVDKQVFRRR